MQRISRRNFLKVSGASVLALYLTQLGCVREEEEELLEEVIYRGWEDLYREHWTWDKVVWGTHCVDCYPGSCLWRVYAKEGLIWREEQAGTYPQIEEDVPDMNPRGCQKGGTFSQVVYAPERLRYPLRRLGERGSGRWERISWDEALTEVADAVLDAIGEVGPESIVYDFGGGHAIIHGAIPGWRLARLLGATVLDSDGQIGDFSVGIYETFGKFHFVSSVDDWVHADLIMVWHCNPLYTRIPCVHYITEARYRGSQVVCIAPDYSATSIHTDLWVPVVPSSDAALALGLCKIILDEGKVNEAFVKDQTDLPLLVRLDNRRFLRQPEVTGEGREDQFYFWDAKTSRAVEAPRGTLALGEVDPALEGRYQVALADGTQVEVTPAFELMKEKAQAYDLETVASITGICTPLIRRLADMVMEARNIHIIQGFDTNKHFHGDLMERSMALLLALTGNFGRKGTGMRGWHSGQLAVLTPLKRRPGMEGFLEFSLKATELEKELREEDPTLTEEMVAIEQETVTVLPMSPITVPAVFFWYWHAGYKDIWNRRDWSDPAMARSFDEYFQEAVDKKWWEGVMLPPPDRPPRVLFEVNSSTLRRTRGGFKVLLERLWPQLKKIVTVDLRMSTTALFSDIVLPVASFYERLDFRFPTAHVNFLTLTEKAAEPPGECKPEWEIFCLLSKKVEERARQREFGEYQDVHGETYKLDDMYRVFTYDGEIREHDDDKLAADIMLDTVRAGAFPERTTLDDLRKDGILRFTGTGVDAPGLNLATDIKPDETINPLSWHVEKKLPYPTLTRRIQFYIDHPWFLEAGEELPVHKPNPRQGGDYPLRLCSGHQRSSIHSTWTVNKTMLYTHRGQPSLFMNPQDAEARGIRDNEEVRVYNDFDSCKVRVKISSGARPGEIIIYAAWEPYQYRDWKPYDTVVPGLIKWLHMAGGYGHLRFWRNNWQPQQIDRAIAVEVEKLA